MSFITDRTHIPDHAELPPDFDLNEWKGKVSPREVMREKIDLGIVTTFFIVVALAAITGLFTWAMWIMWLISG